MKKAILAVLALSVLLLAAVPAGYDAEDQSFHVRQSNNDLYYAKCTASFNSKVTEGLYVYEVGQDSSMRAYINGTDHMATPERGLSSVIEGHTYEVYATQEWKIKEVSEYANPKTVLRSYYAPLTVSENQLLLLTVKSIVSNLGTTAKNYDVLFISPSGISEKSYAVDETARIGYEKGTLSYLSVYRYVQQENVLYFDVVGEIGYKSYAGSPMLYVVLCVIVVALVAATIAFCGRKPKLD
jgi:hypothetical protein